MSRTMKAIRKTAARPGLVVEEIPIPELGPHDVLIRVIAASICGTDIHIWKWNEWSQQRVHPPITIGHEFAGTVVEVGSAVEHVRVGEYVSAESHITCGMCFQCRTGQAHMCPKTKVIGVDRDGAFAEYVVLPESVIWHNDPTKLPPEIATLQEPFGNAVYATLAHDLAAQTVAVFGCGPIGCFAVAIAKASGAAAVFATDIVDYRLELAKRMGADAIYNPKHDPKTDADGRNGTTNWLIEANEGYGIDVVLEMSGSAEAITSAFRAVRNGGRVTLFGLPSRPVEIDVAENMIFKNLTVLALNGRRIFDTWYQTRWMLERGVVDLRPLITRELLFDEIDEAMQLLSSGQACKIVLRPKEIPIASTPAPGRPEPPDANVRGIVRHP
jgi:threonine 3-dehydrogenase